MIRQLAFAVALVAVFGCSISNSSNSLSNSSNSSSNSSESSGSSSDSLSKSSDSSSGSSGGGDDQAYRDDVRDYTHAYVLSGGEFSAFQRGLGDIARRHGITNWEVRRATYRGIGAGLGKAGASQTQLDEFKANLAASSPEKLQDMQDGYESVI